MSKIKWFTDNYAPYQRVMFKIKREIARKKSKYQDTRIVEFEKFGKGVIMDGIFQSCVQDEFIYHECLVHPAIFALNTERPLDILILGAGEGATLRELLKYKNIKSITTVDIDEVAVNMFKKYLPEMHEGNFDHPKVKLIFDSADHFLATNKQKFDVVFSDITDYTFYCLGAGKEKSQEMFYKDIYNSMKDDGVLALHTTIFDELNNDAHFKLRNFIRKVFPQAHSYRAFVPSFVSAWGFLVAPKKRNWNMKTLGAVAVGKKIKKHNLKLKFLTPKMVEAIFTLSPVLSKLENS